MVRSSNPNDIIKDIETKLERTVQADLKEVNRDIRDNTPYNNERKSGTHARDRWRSTGEYKLGVSKKMFENKATYIGILDAGSVRSKYGPKMHSLQGIKPHSGPSDPIADKGIVAPALEKILTRRRKIN
tara:strand:+ start:394 stop:780 length:387 start_codon:yes stop_codon:yes gene_type:complete